MGMFGYDLINIVASKEADRQRFANLVSQHVDAGGSVTAVDGYTQKPLPLRSEKIDPETILHRKRPKK